MKSLIDDRYAVKTIGEGDVVGESSQDAPAGSSAPAASAARPGVREVKSAARTVDLLALLASRRNTPVRLTELSTELDAPRSSVHALLRTLVERGWVRTDASGTLYSIGLNALVAGTTYLDVDPLLRIVQPQINAVSIALDETIHYGRLSGTDIVYLASRESSQYVRQRNRVGRTLPAYATSLGKAILAARLEESERPGEIAHLIPEELEPLTHRTITDHDALEEELRASTARGYAIDDEENVKGLRCFALPLRIGGPVSDAISCSIPLERLGAREGEIIAALRHAQLSIEQMAPPFAGGAFQ